MRAPLLLACSPAPSSMTPALTNSSLNFAIAPSSSSDGILPASESLLALTITIKRIVPLPAASLVGTRAALPQGRKGCAAADNLRQQYLRPFAARDLTSAGRICEHGRAPLLAHVPSPSFCLTNLPSRYEAPK